jgi:hypothetical protein
LHARTTVEVHELREPPKDSKDVSAAPSGGQLPLRGENPGSALLPPALPSYGLQLGIPV